MDHVAATAAAVALRSSESLADKLLSFNYPFATIMAFTQIPSTKFPLKLDNLEHSWLYYLQLYGPSRSASSSRVNSVPGTPGTPRHTVTPGEGARPVLAFPFHEHCLQLLSSITDIGYQDIVSSTFFMITVPT